MVKAPVKTRLVAVAFCVVLQSGQVVLAQQWADSGSSIYSTNSGNVGIGTTGPATKLHVVTDDATNSNITNILTLTHTTTGVATGESGSVTTGPGFNPDTGSSLLTGLKAYYKLDEASGTRFDSIGGHTLTQFNGLTSAAGKVNGAGQFTAASITFLRTPVPAGSDLQVGDLDFSIAAWVYLDSKGSAVQAIAGQFDYNSTLSWQLWYIPAPTDRFRFTTVNAANSFVQVDASSFGSPSIGTWYHVVAWHDKTTNTNNIKVNNGTTNSAAANIPRTITANFQIGAVGGNIFQASPWNGRIDEVGFWKKILSAQEISDLYNNGNGNTYSASGFTLPPSTPIGTGISLQTESGSGAAADSGRISSVLTNAAAGAETSALKLETRNSGGSLTERARISEAGLQVTGDFTVTGNIIAKYQDLAEWVSAARPLPPGTVVVVDHEHANFVAPSLKPYDTRVAGVVSSNPGIVLGEAKEGKVKVATTGRVTMRVDATRAPIRVGDLLVTGDKEGVAMRSEPVNVAGVEFHRSGTLVGKALESLAHGEGEILVLLGLQ